MSTGSRPRSRLIVGRDLGEFRRNAADILAKKISETAKAKGTCSVALSGGSTPGPVYELLGGPDFGARLPWDQLEIYFADERAVPLDHPDSTYDLVRRTLLKEHPECWGRMYRMPADAPDREAAAEHYARRLPKPLDVLVLGMGPDGHTASLFPGSPLIGERDRWVAPVEDAPKPPPRRMTLTPPAIQSAKDLYVLVTGVEKSPMLARALDRHVDPSQVPAQLARHGTWIVDAGAASGIL